MRLKQLETLAVTNCQRVTVDFVIRGVCAAQGAVQYFGAGQPSSSEPSWRQMEEVMPMLMITFIFGSLAMPFYTRKYFFDSQILATS